MFFRIKKSTKKSRTHEYLVLNESIRDNSGRSTAKDVANLGNVARFDKTTVENLIDGLIRLFHIEQYGPTDQIEILESLDYGSIILWRALWKRMRLGKIVADEVRRVASRVTIDVAKYAEMMVVNRCVNPQNKLAASCWVDSTCYAAMDGYADLPTAVE